MAGLRGEITNAVLATQIANLAERMDEMREHIKQIREASDETKNDVTELKEEFHKTINRYGGGIAAVLGIGTLMGWIVSLYNGLKH